MINFDFSLTVPKNEPSFDTWWLNEKMFKKWKHKTYSMQIVNRNNLIFEVAFNANFKTDHAGVSLAIGLFGIVFYGSIVDCRHWDDETNDYKVYD
jgi:hypothetical protein